MGPPAEFLTEPDVDLPALGELLDDVRVQRLLALDRAFWYEQDLRTNDVRWTGGLLRSFGYEVAQIAPHPSWWQEHVHPDDVHVLFALWEDLVRRQRTRWRLKYRFRRADDSYAMLEGHAMLVVNADGEPVRVSGVVRDVSEQEHLQARLVRAERLGAIGKLAGGLVHDLNNFLTVLSATLELIGDDPVAHDRHKGLLVDSSAALDRASALATQLLTIAQHTTHTSAPTDMVEVVRGFWPLLERAAPTCKLVPRLSPVPLLTQGDPGQLERIALNLVSNARDACPKGAVITVELERRELTQRVAHQVGEVPAGAWNVLAVVDEGSGILPEVLAQVLEPFFTTKGRRGAGLGLPTVQSVIDQWDGHLTIDSVPGVGTTVACYLPTLP